MQQSLIDALLHVAREALSDAHAPYSGFRVGAAVLTASNKVYSGCNVENASYGLTVCAERVAVLKAVSEGEKMISAVAIVVSGDQMARPCGACLQVLREFAGDPAMPVVTACEGADTFEVHPLKDYLPMPFVL